MAQGPALLSHRSPRQLPLLLSRGISASDLIPAGQIIAIKQNKVHYQLVSAQLSARTSLPKEIFPFFFSFPKKKENIASRVRCKMEVQNLLRSRMDQESCLIAAQHN